MKRLKLLNRRGTRPIPGPGRSGRAGNGDLQLLAASVLTGLAAALFVIVVELDLGLEAFAPIAQLWTIWSIAAATLMFAFQQWSIQLGLGRGGSISAALASGPWLLVAGATIGTGAIAFAVRGSLFHSDSTSWPVAAMAVVLGAIFSGLTRGVLAVEARHGALAIAIAGENLIRIALAIVLVGVTDEAWPYALALLTGFAIIGLLGTGRGSGNLAERSAIDSVRPATDPDPDPDQPPVAPDAHPAGDALLSPEGGPAGSTAVTGSSTLGSAAVAGFLSHAALAAPPLLLAFNGAAAATVSATFVVLTAVRLPHLLLQAGAPRAGVVFRAWVEAGDIERQNRARLAIVGVGLVLAAVATAAGAALGDLTIGAIFNIRGQVDAWSYGLTAAAAVLSVGATIATVLLVAQGRHRFLIVGWAVPLTMAAVIALATRSNDLGPFALGLAVLHAVVLLTLGAAGPPAAGRATRGT